MPRPKLGGDDHRRRGFRERIGGGGENLRTGVERVPLRLGRTAKITQGAATESGARKRRFAQRTVFVRDHVVDSGGSRILKLLIFCFAEFRIYSFVYLEFLRGALIAPEAATAGGSSLRPC